MSIAAQQVVPPLTAMKQALEALEFFSDTSNSPMDKAMSEDAITSLRQAIAELESREPVAWSYWQSCLNDDGTQTAPWVHRFSKFKPHESIINKDVIPLYTHPPQRTEQEQPLPPVEIGVDVTADGASVVAFYRRPNAVMEMFYSQFHPAPQRTWVGLTDEEILKMAYPIRWEEVDDFEADKAVNFAQMVEAKLKEKNNGT